MGSIKHLYNVQLQERDIEIIKFINIFGYTFLNVLRDTFFETNSKTANVASKRMRLLEKGEYIYFRETGIKQLNRAIFLTKKAKSYLHNEVGLAESDIIKHKELSSVYKHQVAEQYTYYALKKLVGTIERTTVRKYSQIARHTPDFIYTTSGGTRIYIEVETNIKSVNSYSSIYKRIRETDEKYRPDRIVYVLAERVQMKTIAQKLPISDSKISISLVNLEDMIKNINEFNQPKTKLLKDVLEEIKN